MTEEMRDSPVPPATVALRVLVEAALLAALFSAVGIAVNLLRPQGLPLVASVPYETLVPCREPGGEVLGILPDDPVLRAERSILIDARSGEGPERSPVAGAILVPYDYLDPTPEGVLAELAVSIARKRAQKVIVVGDGERPDCGEMLGREISGKGIKNVVFVVGGAPALAAVPSGGGR